MKAAMAQIAAPMASTHRISAADLTPSQASAETNANAASSPIAFPPTTIALAVS